MEDYLTVMEAATEIGISYPTLTAKIRRGQIPFTKRGWNVFLHRDDVAAYKNARDMKKGARRDKLARKNMASSAG